MRSRLLAFLVLALTAAGAAGAEPAAAALPEMWFPVGERLIYSIYWGRIPVGNAVVTTEWVEEDGRTLLAIRCRTRTNNFLSRIYPVDDFLETLVEPASFLPVRFTKRLSEGRYRADQTTNFDFERLRASWRNNRSGKTNEFELARDTRDLVSFMYYMRKGGIAAGTNLQYRVMADEKIYDLFVTTEKTEPVKLDVYGKVWSLRLEPKAAFGGLFVRKGRMWMWVSEDPRRLATKIAAQVPVANVNLLLDRVEGPGDDFWVTVPKEGDGS